MGSQYSADCALSLDPLSFYFFGDSDNTPSGNSCDIRVPGDFTLPFIVEALSGKYSWLSGHIEQVTELYRQLQQDVARLDDVRKEHRVLDELVREKVELQLGGSDVNDSIYQRMQDKGWQGTLASVALFLGYVPKTILQEHIAEIPGYSEDQKAAHSYLKAQLDLFGNIREEISGIRQLFSEKKMEKLCSMSAKNALHDHIIEVGDGVNRGRAGWLDNYLKGVPDLLPNYSSRINSLSDALSGSASTGWYVCDDLRVLDLRIPSSSKKLVTSSPALSFLASLYPSTPEHVRELQK